MKRVIILVLALVTFLMPQPASAGPAIWNPSGTIAAYVEYLIAPGSKAGFEEDYFVKALYFYNEAENSRYRANYCSLGAFLASYRCGESVCPASYIKIVNWKNDTTIIVEVSHDEGFLVSATYEVSTDGRTVFLDYSVHESNTVQSLEAYGYLRWRTLKDNLEQNMWMWLSPGQVVFDDLETAIAVDEFLNGVCTAETLINHETFPLSEAGDWSEWQTISDVHSSLDWLCESALPLTDFYSEKEGDGIRIWINLDPKDLILLYRNNKVKVVDIRSP